MTNFHKIIFTIIGIIIIIIIGLFIYFNISYSPLKNKFSADFERAYEHENDFVGNLREEDFINFPTAIQKYLSNNGYLGQKKMTYAYIKYEDVDFYQSPERKLLIDYSQYNIANKPQRLALVESSMAGIPFEGYDYYIDGKGGMDGMLGKLITLFQQKGSEMDKGALCTYLSEVLFVPASILDNPNITFEEIDPYNVYATIEDKEIKVSGIFTFNENYEMTKFYTEDRPSAQDDGSIKYAPWSANVLSYKETPEGVNFINHVQIIWHYPEGDFIYFDGIVSDVVFD